MYAIILGAIVLLLFLTLKPSPDQLNPGHGMQSGGGPLNVCSPGSDVVIDVNVAPMPVKDPATAGPIQNCLSSLRMTRADEDQLNIINHREYNNLSWVLRKPLKCARKRINCLQETSAATKPSSFVAHNLSDEPTHVQFKTWDSGCCDRGLMNIDPCNAASIESGKNTPKLSKCEKDLLGHLSPVPMKTSLKGYYGDTYYYDFRYPREPIHLDFASDPEGFCRKNPGLYPCYVRASRYDLK